MGNVQTSGRRGCSGREHIKRRPARKGMRTGFALLVVLLAVSLTVTAAQGVLSKELLKPSYRTEMMGRVVADFSRTNEGKLAAFDKLARLEMHQLRKLDQLGRAEREQALNLTEEELGKLAVLGRTKMQAVLRAGDLRAQVGKLTVKTMARNFRNRPLLAAEKTAFTNKLMDFRAAFTAERAAAEVDVSRALGNRAAYTTCRDNQTSDNQTTGVNCTEVRTQVINATKGALLHHVNMLASHIEKIVLRYRENEFLPANETEQVIQRLEGLMQQLRELSSGIAAAETPDELKEQLAKVRSFWRENHGELHLLGTRILRSKAAEIIRQSQILQQRMERVLVVMEQHNASTLEIEGNVTLFEQKLDAAREAYSESQAAFTSAHNLRLLLLAGNITAGEKIELGLVVKHTRASALQAHQLLGEARAILNGVFRTVKLLTVERLENAEEPIAELDETENVSVDVRPAENI